VRRYLRSTVLVVPVLGGICASLATAIEARHDCGDHTLILGMRDYGRAPLLYYGSK